MKALLVEDTMMLRKTIREALTEEGYAVEVAVDGKEAIEKVEVSDYDIIILDVMLPGLDGFSALKAIRKVGQTPVIMLTARDAISDRVKGLDLGADDYLTKPFDLDELMARLRAIARRRGGDRSPHLEVGKVSLDTAARKAFLKGEEINLTSREYVILETLIRQRNQVVSRAFLYEHLYVEDETTLSNVLDVYIWRLRSKLGKDFIKTRRGFGYIVEQ